MATIRPYQWGLQQQLWWAIFYCRDESPKWLHEFIDATWPKVYPGGLDLTYVIRAMDITDKLQDALIYDESSNKHKVIIDGIEIMEFCIEHVKHSEALYTLDVNSVKLLKPLKYETATYLGLEWLRIALYIHLSISPDITIHRTTDGSVKISQF